MHRFWHLRFVSLVPTYLIHKNNMSQGFGEFGCMKKEVGMILCKSISEDSWLNTLLRTSGYGFFDELPVYLSGVDTYLPIPLDRIMFLCQLHISELALIII